MRWRFLLALLLAGCLGGPASPPGSDDVATPEPSDLDGFGLERLAGGFSQPLLVTHAGDGSGRLFVVEQCGQVHVTTDWTVVSPWLDVSDALRCSGEQGLLGLAFPPDHATTGRFYIDYTDTTGASVLERWQTNGGAPTGTPEVLLSVPQPASNHNGGHLAFGPDGYLYWGLGDGGAADDAFRNGQNKATLLGSVLRLDVSGASGYGIPGDNPFVDDATGADEIWSWGLRNPWRFSFDRATGDLWLGDVGQNAWEEIDHEAAGGPGGVNYGWPAYEGTHAYPRGVAVDHTLPVAEYATGGGDCSVTGGYVYRGSDVPALQGHYLAGDYCSGMIRSVIPDGDKWRLLEHFDSGLRISSFGEDEDGEVYVVDHQGTIHKFVAE